MLKRIGWLIGVGLLVGGGLASAQTNPCDTPPGTVTLNPSRVTFRSVDHGTLLLEGPAFLVSGYELRYYAEGAPSPFQTVTFTRDVVTLAPGTTDCYVVAPASWPLTPGQRYRAVMIAIANPSANVANSPPSEESNPFGRVSPPQAPVIRVPSS